MRLGAIALLSPVLLLGFVASAPKAQALDVSFSGPKVESGAVDPEVEALIQKMIAETEKNPKDGATFGKLGLAYDANAMPKAALQAFRRAAQLDKKEPRWPYHQARMEFVAGNAGAALKAVDASIALKKDYPPAYQLRGDLLLDSGKAAEAEKSYRAMLAIEPKSIAGRVGLARAKMQANDNKAAIPILEEILKETPGNAYIFQLLGNALRRVGQQELAKKALARAMNPVEPRWPDPWRDESEVYAVGFANKLQRASAMAQGAQGAEGIRALEELRGTHPTNAALLANLGAAYCRAGRLDEGIATLEAAIRERPEHSSALLNLSQAYETKGRMQDALDTANKAVQAHPELVHAHLRKGFVLAKLGRKEEALRSFETARRVDARSATTLFWCGVMRAELQRWPEAVVDFEAVLAQDPRLPATHVWLARARAEVGDLSGAREALRVAEKQNPPPQELDAFRKRIEEI
ncbi:MAG TPA: tetratricopeptide repeat protein, partial [bacterium]|nr:tetratricopeptide repeat protein [bacterium]